MTDLQRVAYCGIYCGLCLHGHRIPQRAAGLRDLLRSASIDEWGNEIPDFGAFWGFLNRLAEFESHAGCRNHSCGPEPCPIRACAADKGVDACPFCASYPCEHVTALAKRYVTLIRDGERMREIGLGRWIEEQEARKACGFAYADLLAPRRSSSA